VKTFIAREHGSRISNDGGGDVMDDSAERDGFSEWLTGSLPDLRKVAARLTPNTAVAADLVQDTCLRALNKKQLFVHGAGDGMRRWLARIMTNRYYDLVREQRFERLFGELDDVPSPDLSPAPWKYVSDADLNAALGQLRPVLRDTYQLFAVERCSYAKISQRLCVPPATVATRIYRARASLRKSLGIERTLQRAA